MDAVAKSPPDGYTVMLATITNAIGATLYTRLNYDLVRDFAPVTQPQDATQVLAADPRGRFVFGSARA